MSKKSELFVADEAELASLFGVQDENLRFIQDQFAVKVVVRDNRISILGEEKDVATVTELFKGFLKVIRQWQRLSSKEVREAVKKAKEDRELKVEEIFGDVILVTERGKPVRPKTPGQKKYVEEIKEKDLVFGIGPAGTGKTYLAMAMAVSALKNREVSRIILTRPAVEAGEKLGYLPGTLYEKIDPYLRPLYDALYDMMDVDTFQRYMERGIIEVAPLAYMRGRTLNDSFIILDEAQNTTYEQMKMFLTRIGFGSKVVVTGDVTQIDLPQGKHSGLNEARKILKSVRGISVVYFTDKDVVRHELVQRIVKAYEEYEATAKPAGSDGSS